jgi:ADP-ribose pyrophosphatase YjhB (NUDIX family)
LNVTSSVSQHPRWADLDYEFCPKCGAPLELKKIKPAEPERLVCTKCHFIFFVDPKVAAATIFQSANKIVLARRAIDPGYGKWVFPGGFVDRGETVEEAACREALEEVHAEVELEELLGVYSYSGVPIVVIVFAAQWVGGELSAADECLEVRAFGPEEIPWEDLAFSSIRDALKDYLRRYMNVTPPNEEVS